MRIGVQSPKVTLEVGGKKVSIRIGPPDSRPHVILSANTFYMLSTEESVFLPELW